jgi:hypothetical protein
MSSLVSSVLSDKNSRSPEAVSRTAAQAADAGTPWSAA